MMAKEGATFDIVVQASRLPGLSPAKAVSIREQAVSVREQAAN
jgi:hypothetical protein